MSEQIPSHFTIVAFIFLFICFKIENEQYIAMKSSVYISQIQLTEQQTLYCEEKKKTNSLSYTKIIEVDCTDYVLL